MKTITSLDLEIMEQRCGRAMQFDIAAIRGIEKLYWNCLSTPGFSPEQIKSIENRLKELTEQLFQKYIHNL